MNDTGEIDRFLASLDRLDVDWSRTSREKFRGAISEILVEPAVGAPLPFPNLSFEDTGIQRNLTPGQLRSARTGVTAAQMGIASYGSLVLQSDVDVTEAVSLFPDLHVAVLRAGDVVPDMKTAFQHLGNTMRDRSSSAVLATGPSATADMGALVQGAHGPKAVHVILLEDG